ncbi:MAG: GNAT family N-acetyltransferase [Planctomycetia bacterium]
MNRPRLSPPVPILPEHDLAGFDCGEPSLNDWLRKRSLKNQATGASRCFVVAEGGKVIGYYTLSAGMIERSAAPRAMRRQTPNSLPVLLLGRMAVDRQWHNQGIGQALLRDALLRSLAVSAEAGVFALLVHALSEPARRFYLSRGFVESPLRPMTLMMTLETIREIVRGSASG